MEKKTFPPRRSSTLLRRIASAALLMLTFHTAAMAFTVTLTPGRGSGSDIVINSGFSANMAANRSSATRGQFWFEGDQLWFKFPDCPGSFTARGDDVFLGWTIDSEDGATLSPGTQYQISKSLTLYAQWGVVEFVENTDFAMLKYAVTNMSPREVSLIEIDEITNGDISIPASVGHDGEEYAVTVIGDGVCKENDKITALTIPATVRSIGSQSFKSCENLTTLTIPAKVRTIGSESFQSCENLTTLTFAEGSQLETIGRYSFSYCKNLRSVYSIPGSVKSPETAGVFRGCPLEIVTIVGHGNYSDYSFKYLFDAPTVQVTLPANEADGAKWTTFYTPKCNFQADEATTVYTAELVGNTLLLHEVQDRIINKENAVILKS
nr:leucine-rich repeat domain-containing protein [Bacteroidaceae bacterium]